VTGLLINPAAGFNDILEQSSGKESINEMLFFRPDGNRFFSGTSTSNESFNIAVK